MHGILASLTSWRSPGRKGWRGRFPGLADEFLSRDGTSRNCFSLYFQWQINNWSQGEMGDMYQEEFLFQEKNNRKITNEKGRIMRFQSVSYPNPGFRRAVSMTYLSELIRVPLYSFLLSVRKISTSRFPFCRTKMKKKKKEVGLLCVKLIIWESPLRQEIIKIAWLFSAYNVCTEVNLARTIQLLGIKCL